MAAPKCLAKHGVFLGKREEELYEIIDAALCIAARRNPKTFASRRDEIAKNLFSLPETVIGSVYERSHSTSESTDYVSDLTKAASKVVADDCMKKGTTPSSKKDDKKRTDRNFGASKVEKYRKFDAANNKKKMERNFEASKAKSPKFASTDCLLDQKFEASKRKFEQTSKLLMTRKTKFMDLSEEKELSKLTRDVKRPRFRR